MISPPRNPTPEMLEAGYEVLKKLYPPKENNGHAIGQHIVWEAMYDIWLKMTKDKQERESKLWAEPHL